MDILVAWGLYLGMAVLLVLGFERYLAGYLTHRRLRIMVRTLLCVGLFTPGIVVSDEGVYVVPACIGVLFNLLARSGPGMMKAALPLLLSSALVFGALYLVEVMRARRQATPAAE